MATMATQVLLGETARDLHDPGVVPPRVTTTTPQSAEPDELFTAEELRQFREEDNAAGRIIGKILATLFLYTVIIMAFVSWWTFRTVGP